MVARLQTLSSEVIGIIAQNCGPSELTAIAQTNRACQIESERILYRIISLSHNNQVVTQAKKCLTVLAQCHQKAMLVQCLNFNFGSVHNEADRLCSLLRKALPKMKGLKSLAIMTGVDKGYKKHLIAAALR